MKRFTIIKEIRFSVKRITVIKTPDPSSFPDNFFPVLRNEILSGQHKLIQKVENGAGRMTRWLRLSKPWWKELS